MRGSIVATVVTGFDTDDFISGFTLGKYVEHVRKSLVGAFETFLGSPEGVSVIAVQHYPSGEPMESSDIVQVTASEKPSREKYEIQACNRCWLLPTDVRPEHPTKTTAEYTDGVYYITPHADTCIRVN